MAKERKPRPTFRTLPIEMDWEKDRQTRMRQFAIERAMELAMLPDRPSTLDAILADANRIAVYLIDNVILTEALPEQDRPQSKMPTRKKPASKTGLVWRGGKWVEGTAE